MWVGFGGSGHDFMRVFRPCRRWCHGRSVPVFESKASMADEDGWRVFPGLIWLLFPDSTALSVAVLGVFRSFALVVGCPVDDAEIFPALRPLACVGNLKAPL